MIPPSSCEVVALTDTLPDRALYRGQVGTMVEILDGAEGFEVEFSDREGCTLNRWGFARSSSSCCGMTPKKAEALTTLRLGSS